MQTIKNAPGKTRRVLNHGSSDRVRSALGSDGNTLVFHMLSQFARGKHFTNDVTAAHEFTFDVKLRDGRPVREILDALTDGWIDKDVDVLERNAQFGKNLNDAAEKPIGGT